MASKFCALLFADVLTGARTIDQLAKPLQEQMMVLQTNATAFDWRTAEAALYGVR